MTTKTLRQDAIEILEGRYLMAVRKGDGEAADALLRQLGALDAAEAHEVRMGLAEVHTGLSIGENHRAAEDHAAEERRRFLDPVDRWDRTKSAEQREREAELNDKP